MPVRFAILLLVLLMPASAAFADADSIALQDLGRIELLRALKQASERIDSGVNGPVELASELLIVGIASARLGDDSTAQRAFLTLVALDPGFRLPNSFSDEVRSPYLEARGYWSTHEVALRASASLDEAGDVVRIDVVDPAGLSARVRLRAKVGRESNSIEIVKPSRGKIEIPLRQLGDGSPIDYSLTLLDERGNRMWLLGSDERPQKLVRDPIGQPLHAIAQAAPAMTQVAPPVIAGASPPAAALEPPPPVAPSDPPEPRREWNPRLFRLGASLSMTTSALSLGGAAYAHFRREQLADDWNDVRCQGSGVTRSAVCADERQQLSRMQNLAISLYAVSGAALVTGVMLLVLAPAKPQEGALQAWRCTGGPTALSLGCTLSF